MLWPTSSVSLQLAFATNEEVRENGGLETAYHLAAWPSQRSLLGELRWYANEVEDAPQFCRWYEIPVSHV